MINLKEFKFDKNKAFKKRQLQPTGKVQKFIDSECIRLMTPMTPFESGALIGSATDQTSIGTGRIVQQTPYAKRWYYEPANFNEAPRRGNKWFERMKIQHKDAILKGAKEIAGGD